MAILYESSNDYEEDFTYAGNAFQIASSGYDSDNEYDRINVTYEGSVSDLLNGYASTSRTYNEVTGYNGANVVSATASGGGTGTSTVTYTTVDVSAIYRGYRNHYTLYPRSDVLYTGEKGAVATGSGTSTQSAVGVNIIPRTATGSGGATAGDSATGLRTAIEIATGSGAGSQTAAGLRTAIETASGSGLGTHTIVAAKASLRAASGAGVGSSSVAAFTTTFKTATGSGNGSRDVALWSNAGETLSMAVIMRPVYGPGFRRRVNYAVQVPRD